MAKIEETIHEWLAISEYDLETAQAMLTAGRYLYVAFMCQQSIEKYLKAIYVHKIKKLPPRTHNLLFLLDTLGLEVPEKHKNLFSKLNQYYLESRYPGERLRLAEEMNTPQAEDIYNETQEAWTCLKKQFVLKK